MATIKEKRELVRKIYDREIMTCLGPAEARAIKHVVEGLEIKFKTLFDAIKHGDEAHQEWLRLEIEKHFSESLE